MKKLFTLAYFLTLALSSLTYFQVSAEELPSESGEQTNQPAPPKREQIVAELKERLVPLVEAALQEHCGEDCPSFRIDPQFGKEATDTSLDDLGFSKPLQLEKATELKSIKVSILIHHQVPQKARESLRKIVTHRLTHRAHVPVVVRLMTLDTYAPLMEKQMQPESTSLSFTDRIRLAKDFAWPVSLLLFAGIAFMALCRVLKHKKDLLSQQLAAKTSPEKEFVSTQKEEGNEGGDGKISHSISNLLHERADDIQWLIEDAALRSDQGTMQKIVTLFPAQELSSRFQLSSKALSSLARAAQVPQNGADSKAMADWISSTLDQAHWVRVEEQSNRLAQIRRYPPEKAKKVFSRLSSTSMKAVFMIALPEERWPELLETLESEERVQLGLTIADYIQATSEIRSILSSQLTAELIQVNDDLKAQFETALESLALYLSEKENQKLWQELSIRTAGKQPVGRVEPLSIDLIFSELEPSAAAEICARLDVNTLSIILNQVSEEVRIKIYETLPKTLQSRLRSTEEKAPSEAKQMKARAALLETYRQFVTGGMVQ